MKDSLGDRMKRYENVNRNVLIPRMYTIIRIDGKAFHTYTRSFKKPFSVPLTSAMNEAALTLCNEIQGVKCAYVQSDEISLILTDFDTYETQPWVGNVLQKIVSLSASIATASFNARIYHLMRNPNYQEKPVVSEWSNTIYDYDEQMAFFDSRVFQLPTKIEVINYLIWRQKDAIRNSISMVAQSHFSPKQLHKKSNTEKLDMIRDEAGDDWNNYPIGNRLGRFITKEPYTSFGQERTRWVIHAVTPEFKANTELQMWGFLPDLAMV